MGTDRTRGPAADDGGGRGARPGDAAKCIWLLKDDGRLHLARSDEISFLLSRGDVWSLFRFGDDIAFADDGKFLGTLFSVTDTGASLICCSAKTGESFSEPIEIPIANVVVGTVLDEAARVRTEDIDKETRLRYGGQTFDSEHDLPDELKGTAFGRSRVRPVKLGPVKTTPPLHGLMGDDDVSRETPTWRANNPVMTKHIRDVDGEVLDTIETSRDSTGHMPGEKWAFDESVTGVFADMLERSIPQYQVMRDLVFDLGCRFVQPKTAIVDLGCSNGLALEPFTQRYGAHNRYVGFEISEPMLKEARERFANWPDGQVKIVAGDLRTEYPVDQSSLTLCVLTLMFVPINYRNKILRMAYRSLVAGGAFILVEKLIGEYPETDELFVDQYHQMKRDNGYSIESIERKRLALEGVQVPVSDRANVEALHAAGFDVVESFFRWCNFAGYLAIKR